MENYLRLLGLCFPFFMNSLGAFMVFFAPKERWDGALLGVTAGIMTASCLFSLIVPAVELSSHLGVLAFLPVCLGTFIGAGFIYFSEKLIKSSGENGGLNKLLWAVTLHNLPEGLAVGFALGSGELGLASALSVSFGIGVQNFPEGLALSLSCFKNGKSKLKSFSYGVVSGVIEPIGAVIGALLVAYLSFLQPWVLAVAAGCMLFVIVEQLIPESVHSKGGVWGFVIGFCIMAALDLCL
jgi:ZIP family zinc transporter